MYVLNQLMEQINMLFREIKEWQHRKKHIKVEDTRYSVKIYLSSTIWTVFTITGYKL